jgi:hypothetical protein
MNNATIDEEEMERAFTKIKKTNIGTSKIHEKCKYIKSIFE